MGVFGPGLLLDDRTGRPLAGRVLEVFAPGTDLPATPLDPGNGEPVVVATNAMGYYNQFVVPNAWAVLISTGPHGETVAAIDRQASTSVQMAGSVDTEADLPPVGEAGDAYIVRDTGEVWFWDTTTFDWINGGSIQAQVTPEAVAGTMATPEVIEAVAGTMTTPEVLTALTGSGKRPVAKDELVFNAEDHGASGSGVSDDTNALRALMAAGAGRTVWLSRTYKISGAVTVQAGTTVTGGGKILVTHNGDGLQVNGSDVTIDNISIEGTYAGATGLSSQRLVAAHPADDSGNTYLSNITLRNLRLSKAGLACVRLRWVKGFEVANCTFTSWGQSGTLVNNSWMGTVHDNAYHHDGTAPYTTTYMVNVSTSEADWTTSPKLDPGSRWVDVYSNYAAGCPWTAFSSHGCDGVRFRSNTLVRNRCAIAGVIVSPEIPAPALGMIVSDNYIDGGDRSNRVGGIRLVGNGAHSRAVISGNVIWRHGNRGTTGGGGVAVTDAPGTVVSGNQISECAGAGVEFTRSPGSVASGNIITDVWGITGSSPAGFYLDYDGTNVTYYTLIGNAVRRGALTTDSTVNVINRWGVDAPNVASIGTYQFGNDWSGATEPFDAFNKHETQLGATSGTGSRIGFYGATPASKRTVTGSKGGNAALTSLLQQLATLGLINDSTT